MSSESIEASQPVTPSDEVLRSVLQNAKRIAIVGLSDKPARDSYEVAAYLIDHGYDIVPINPSIEQVLGRKAYASLGEVPEAIDVVDVFRKSEAVPAIAREAVAAGAKVLWLQLGVRHDEAAREAAAAGVTVVQDRCIKREHSRLAGA